MAETSRAPRRRQHYRPKVKGCYECSQRRINCDRSEPECRKCISKGLKCSGLGIRHRFHAGVAARGRWAGMTMQSIYAERAPSLPSTTWTPESSAITSGPGPISQAGDSNIAEAAYLHESMASSNCPAARAVDEPGMNEIIGSQNSQIRQPVKDLEELPLEKRQMNPFLNTSTGSCATSVQWPSEQDEFSRTSAHRSRRPVKTNNLSVDFPRQIPEAVPSWKRGLLLHFSEHIAKEMVAIDGIHNGWRHLVLPLAHTNQLVMDAVLAVSAFHLSSHEAKHKNSSSLTFRQAPGFSFFAGQQRCPDSHKLYAHAILGLKQRQELGACGRQDRCLVLLTILILLVSVMVTGSKDFPILFHMLQSALQAIGGENGLDDDDLAQFIIRQIHKIRFYAAPFLGEENDFMKPLSQENMFQVFECLNYCARQRPDAASAVPLIMSLVQQAHEIYLRQLVRDSSSSPVPGCAPRIYSVTPSLSDSSLVQRFKETLEAFPPGSSGEQVLIWATFIAASACAMDEHKVFFENVLLGQFQRSGFINVLSGLEHLHTIWGRGSSAASWTSLLPQTRVFIM